MVCHLLPFAKVGQYCLTMFTHAQKSEPCYNEDLGTIWGLPLSGVSFVRVGNLYNMLSFVVRKFILYI